MENKKGKIALNDDLLDQVSGGGGGIGMTCGLCGSSLDNFGNCTNSDCPACPVYVPPNSPDSEYRVL